MSMEHSFCLFYSQIFFRSIWSVAFCKNVFIFWYSYMDVNLNVRIFKIFFLIKVNVYAWFYNILYLLTMSSNLSIYTFFDTEVIYLWILFIKALINLQQQHIFLYYVLNAFLCYYSVIMLLSLICCKLYCPYLPIFCFVYFQNHSESFEKH